MKKLFKTMRLSKLHNHEHFSFFTQLRVLLDESSAVMQKKVQAQLDALAALYQEEDDAMQKIMGSAVTEKVVEADGERDALFNGLVQAVKVALSHFSSKHRDAAKRLRVVLNAYGNLARMTYSAESSGIYNLMQDLNGKYAPDVALLQLTDWVAELEASNQRFNQLYKERGDETAERTELIMKECRLKTDEAYRNLIDTLEALAIVEGDEAYRDFARRHNVDIGKFTDMLARRNPKEGVPNVVEGEEEVK